MNQGRLPWRQMPEKSGMEALPFAITLAGKGATCCPEAGVTAAVNIASRSKCRCKFMVGLPSMVCLGCTPRYEYHTMLSQMPDRRTSEFRPPAVNPGRRKMVLD